MTDITTYREILDMAARVQAENRVLRACLDTAMRTHAVEREEMANERLRLKLQGACRNAGAIQRLAKYEEHLGPALKAWVREAKTGEVFDWTPEAVKGLVEDMHRFSDNLSQAQAELVANDEDLRELVERVGRLEGLYESVQVKISHAR